MQLSANQISGSPRKIGTLHGKAVMEIMTKGGLYLDVVATENGVKTLGAGPHRAVSRHIARTKNPDLVLTELSKGDDLELWVIEPLLEKYEALTVRFQSRE